MKPPGSFPSEPGNRSSRQSVSSIANLYRDSRRAAAWGIALSLGLGLVKFAGGYFGHSLALISDALHSFVDAAISGALMAALLVAERPADPEHPYGHGRMELVAGAGVALVFLFLAAGIAWEAIATIHVPHPPPHIYTLVIAACGAVFQEGLYHYTSRVARQSGSGALTATAWDYRLDALGGLAVVLGRVAFKVGRTVVAVGRSRGGLGDRRDRTLDWRPSPARKRQRLDGPPGFLRKSWRRFGVLHRRFPVSLVSKRSACENPGSNTSSTFISRWPPI